MTNFLRDGPRDGVPAFLLAHGAGAPMDTPFMNAFAVGLGGAGFAVARFEFAYMAARRMGGGKKPAPRAERLMDEYRDAIAVLGARAPLFIGGKSLGGRVASLIAQEEFDAGRVSGLVCLGYPFHPPGKPEKLRTAHLAALTVPMLVVQGERDPFGGVEEVAGYGLPGTISLHWAPDGDHSLEPRKRSGRTAEQNRREAVAAIAGWASRIS